MSNLSHSISRLVGMRARWARRIVGAIVALSAGVAVMPCAASAENWSALSIPSPSGATNPSLSRVSCASADACTAIGNYVVGGFLTGFVERWDGTSWSLQATPALAGPAQFTDVSCPSTSFCMLVARSSQGALAEDWNGRSWRLQRPRAESSVSELWGVSCTSATACTAVGDHLQAGEPETTLAERWDGAEWTIQPTPNAVHFINDGLYGVSCASPKSCLAVGFYLDPATFDAEPFAASWNGTSWMEQLPLAAGESELNRVSCSSPDACTAVETLSTNALVERWNGLQWTMQTPVASPGSVYSIEDISCSRPRRCTLVGEDLTGMSGWRVLVEAWNGAHWFQQSTPNPATHGNGLGGVSCVLNNKCMGVSDDDVSPSTLFALQSS